jgi:hypothetical protein
LAARFVRDEEVVGSNPATPTEEVAVQGHLLVPVGDPESFAAPRVVCGANRGECLSPR